MEKFKFEELRVYQSAIELINDIYSTTSKFPKEELFGVTSQLRRAALSIALNIAEGSSRKKNDFRHFLDIARGSCYECVTILLVAKNQTYISDKIYTEKYSQCMKIVKMINSLKTSLLRTTN